MWSSKPREGLPACIAKRVPSFLRNNNNNDLLTDPLGGSSLLNYINYNYKINQIKLFTNYTVEAGLTESNYSKTNVRKFIALYSVS